MLALRQLLVEAPENLDDAKRRGRDWIGEVTTRGGDGADDGDTSLALRRAQAAREARALQKGNARTGGVVCVGGGCGG